MKKKSAFLALLLACLMSFSVFGSACTVKQPGTNGGNNTEQGGEEKPETTLTSDTAISLVAGQTWTLTASSGVKWESSDTSVATVNNSGQVTAKSKGVTKITATKQGEVLTCTVIVLAASEASSSGKAKDPFTFSKSIQIGSVESTGSGPVVSDPNADEYTVNFSDGAISQNVAKGGLAVEPLVENDGHYLKGWYKDSAKSELYDFSQPVTGNLNLVADWGENPAGFELIKGNEESIALEWSGSATDVKYALRGTSDWKTIDAELVREDGGYVRADILGLKAGVYDVQANGKTITEIPVKAYDRSGYAHFKYDKGVGAYNDDGTLKENALVIYVTDENKDTVMTQVAEKNADVKMFQIPYSGYGKDWNKDENGNSVPKYATGIGWWLNNNQYTSSNVGSSNNKQPSNTYDSANGGKLGFKMVERPIVIRFIGTVTTPEGCTSYDHTDEGGGIGDNGHMARMKNLANVTLEGVGDDAVIQGWGFHYVAGGDADKSKGQGTSFEVRNLTFNEYPEDAVGMEGQAESTKITAPVERCWIHNNTFLPGRCDNPAESDKHEGDGSCDFKRGYYFTASYNYFEYCHKTNLIGSSDKSLQYNMTYHHNIWYQCGSRIPLTRQANVHFYNNYVFGDPAEKTTPYSHISKPSLSYVHSLRANCYLFSEYNYYEGCKNILRGASEGGDGKFFGNTYYACSDTKAPVTEVGSRTQAVSNNCKDPTNSTSYATFDTDPNLFYYDATNKKTNCLLDDSLSARLRTIFYAGAQGHGEVTAKMQEMNNSAPVTNPSITKAVKGKGQVYVFCVAAKAELTIDAVGETPQVIRNDGKVYLDSFSGQEQVWLDPGVYMVCAGKKDKEITINSLSVAEDSEQAKAARISKAETLISNIPDTITRSSGTAIDQAASAYKNLKAEERTELADGMAERLAKAQAAYEEILVAYAIARIDYIGEVTLDSKNDLEEAAKAYAALSVEAQAKVTNYNKLVAANATFAGFAVDSVKFEIDRLPVSTSLSILVDSKPAVELALDLYNDAHQAYTELDPDDRKNIDVDNVNAAIELLNKALADIELAEQQAQNLATFKELIASMDASDVDMVKAAQLKECYEALTAEQKATVTAEQKSKYDTIIAAYIEYISQAVNITFLDGKPSSDIIKHTGVKQSAKSKEFIVNAYNPNEALKTGLKLESTTELTLTLATKMTVSFYLLDYNTANTVAVNGVPVELKQVNGDNVATITLEAGTYKITRAKSENSLYYMTLVPAK